MGEEWCKAVKEKVNKLLNANFIKEVMYSTWLTNGVMVKKASGKWRMCIDYTDLNRVCLKESYPLPYIDTLTDEA